jgi:RNA polymerase primary sigma factor
MMTRSIEEYRERLRAGTTRPLPDYPEGSRERLYAENEWRVERIVRGRIRTDDEDVIQAGHVGCWKATERFDPSVASFSTYGTYHVRNEAGHECRRRELIHTPAYLLEAIRGGKHARRLKEAKAVQAIRFHGIGREPGEVQDVAGEDADEAAGLVMLDELREAIAAAMTALWHADRRLPEIMARRFGLGGREPEMLREIGERFGVSRERTRQLVDRGLEVLRVHLERSMAS